jgi:DNA-binding transcriptional ArsR family regulator
MREKNYSTGLRGVLFEAQHYSRMGAAVWLYGWLVLRQTHQSGSLGFVLGGKPVSYREIEEETGFNPRTLERWMRTLRDRGYIETEAVGGGVVIRITKAKKFQRFPQGARNGAEGVAGGRDRLSNLHFVAGIGSSSVEREKERATATASGLDESQRTGTTQLQRRTQQHANQRFQNQQRANQSFANRPVANQAFANQARRIDGDTRVQPAAYAPNDYTRRSLLRAERDEALRRELAVGTGPEVRRS